MAKRIYVLTVLVLILFTGCATPLPMESSTPTLPPTLIPLPSATRRNSVTPTPTATSELGLRTDGPYLSYFREVNGEYQFVMMDGDGMGQKTFSIPTTLMDTLSDAVRALDTRLVSPDGTWLAVYTGWAGVPDVFPPSGIFDLTLNLYNFSTGELDVVAPLLSSDYPDNFIKAAGRSNDPIITTESLYAAFMNGITRSLSWSPDGKYLAFAGQMDGLSSDLYIYEVETKTIRHLSNEDQQIQGILWSPDGKWILYDGANQIGVGMKFDVYAAAVDGSSTKRLSVTTSGFSVWVNSHSYLEYDNDYELGTVFGLRIVDVNTGLVRKVWDGPVRNFGLNAEKAKLAFITRLFDNSPLLSVTPDPNFVPALYLMDLNTFTKTKVDVPDNFDFSGSYFIRSFNLRDNVFVLTEYNHDQKPYLLSDTGVLTELDLTRVSEIIGSPDSSHWAAITDKAVTVYSANDMLINSIPLPFQDPQFAFFAWRQDDSSSLFAFQDTHVYYLNIASGDVRLLESNLIRPLFSVGGRWIDGK